MTRLAQKDSSDFFVAHVITPPRYPYREGDYRGRVSRHLHQDDAAWRRRLTCTWYQVNTSTSTRECVRAYQAQAHDRGTQRSLAPPAVKPDITWCLSNQRSERGWLALKPRNLFGDRDWNDVRNVTIRRTRKRFPRARQDDIEDAVSLAMVDLVDYWVTLASSIIPDDPERTFWQACKRGTWMATTFLTQEWDARDVPVEALSTDRDDAPSLGITTASVPSPEDIVIRNMEREGFQRFLGSQMSVVGDWLKPFVAGVSTREQARIEGVSQSAVAYRWQRRMSAFVADASSWRVELA